MPKIVAHDERRTQIAEAITQIIMLEGFERVTMREIASKAGFAHGIIIRYFPNKQSMLAAAVRHLYAGTTLRLDEALADSRGLDGIERMIRALLPFGAESRLRARAVIAFWNHAAHNAELAEIHLANNLRWRERFTHFFAQAKEDGTLSHGADIGTTVSGLLASLAGWQMIAVLLPEYTAHEYLEKELAAQMAAIRVAAFSS